MNGFIFASLRMVTRRQLAAVFGAKKVHRAPAEALEAVRIPKRSRVFLQTVGVPDVSYWELTFGGVEESIPTLAELGREEGDKHWECYDIDHFRWLGFSDIGQPYWCIDEQSRGALVTIDLPSFSWEIDDDGKRVDLSPEDTNFSPTFVNSNVENFSEFMYVYETRVRDIRKLKKSSNKKHVFEKMVKQLRKIDRSAFSSNDHWWPLILEENAYAIEDD